MSLYDVAAMHVPAHSATTPKDDFYLFCSCGWSVTIDHYQWPFLEDRVKAAGDAFTKHKEVTLIGAANEITASRLGVSGKGADDVG